jgi:DNA-binding transcriptional LysR family regulator
MDKFEALFATGGLSLDRLRNFCFVAEAGGLSKAAGGDPGRMSLYSRQVKELEIFFGTELTRRHGKGIAITPQGHRLARLARGQLLGLEDFQRTCRSLPASITLASGNSVLEWAVLPRLGELRAALPELHLDVASLRTSDIVARLRDMTLDFGLIREDAVQAASGQLRSQRLFGLSYSLFAPRALLAGRKHGTLAQLRQILSFLPLAATAAGQFREQLELSAAAAKCPMKLELTCSSFTQAARAVKSGCYAAILPTIAEVNFEGMPVTRVPVPFLRQYTRVVCLAWNPRMLEIKTGCAEAAAVFERILKAADGR